MALNCVICIEVIESKDSVVSTICGHVFHKNCFESWLKKTKNCPKCRKPIENNQVHRIYLDMDDPVKKDQQACEASAAEKKEPVKVLKEYKPPVEAVAVAFNGLELEDLLELDDDRDDLHEIYLEEQENDDRIEEDHLLLDIDDDREEQLFCEIDEFDDHREEELFYEIDDDMERDSMYGFDGDCFV